MPADVVLVYAALEDLTCAAARSRGRCWLTDRPDTLPHWDAAGGALCVESAGSWLASLPDAAWDMLPPVPSRRLRARLAPGVRRLLSAPHFHLAGARP